MTYKEVVWSLLKAETLTVGTGAVELAEVKAKCPEVFVDVLRYRQRFMEVHQSIVDRVECGFNYNMNNSMLQQKVKVS